MGTLIGFSMIILIASILQTSTGFGFSIMATPFLLLLFPPREAIQINLLLSFVISAALVFQVRKEVDWVLFRHIMWGSVVGLPVGIFIFTIMDTTILKVSVAILIIVLTCLLIGKWRMKRTRKRNVIAGSLSGLLTTSIGMPGPPLLLYFAGTNTSKAALRSTTLTFYLFVYFTSIIFQVSLVGTSAKVGWTSLQALPLVVIGLVVGQFLFPRINQQIFQLITYGLLMLSGVYLLLQQLG